MKLKDAIELAKQKYYPKHKHLPDWPKTPKITKRHQYFMNRYGWTFEQADHWIKISRSK